MLCKVHYSSEFINDLKVGVGWGVKFKKIIILFSIVYGKQSNKIHLLVYNK